MRVLWRLLPWLMRLGLPLISAQIALADTPVTVTDIVTFLGAAGTFTALICGTLAGLKYGADAINNRAPNASPQVQPPDAPPPVGAGGKL